MAGIYRINITDQWKRNPERRALSKALEPAANEIYQKWFRLIDDKVYLRDCKLGSEQADQDTTYGKDLYLFKNNGDVYTVQEKLLSAPYKTVTFTTVNHNGTAGLWTTCKADIWFVGYGRNTASGDNSIQDWMIIKFAELRDLDKQRVLPWKYNQNNTNGEKAKFQYLDFHQVPRECVLASSDEIEFI